MAQIFILSLLLGVGQDASWGSCVYIGLRHSHLFEETMTMAPVDNVKGVKIPCAKNSKPIDVGEELVLFKKAAPAKGPTSLTKVNP